MLSQCFCYKTFSIFFPLKWKQFISGLNNHVQSWVTVWQKSINLLSDPCWSCERRSISGCRLSPQKRVSGKLIFLIWVSHPRCTCLKGHWPMQKIFRQIGTAYKPRNFLRKKVEDMTVTDKFCSRRLDMNFNNCFLPSFCTKVLHIFALNFYQLPKLPRPVKIN